MIPNPKERMSDLVQSLETRWSKYLGCRPAQLRDGGRHVVGYVLDGRLVSVGQVQAHHDEYAWEFGVDTLPEFRRRGFATAVLKSVIAYVIAKGHVPYHYADIYNKPSLRLPQKLGCSTYCEVLVGHSQGKAL